MRLAGSARRCFRSRRYPSPGVRFDLLPASGFWRRRRSCDLTVGSVSVRLLVTGVVTPRVGHLIAAKAGRPVWATRLTPGARRSLRMTVQRGREDDAVA